MFEAVHTTVIKGYLFSESVWQPEALAEGFDFLTDAGKLWQCIEQDSKRDLGKVGPFKRCRKRTEVKGLGWLKPIRNPRHRGSAFWLNLFPEHLREMGVLDYRRPLPLFPLQVLPYKSLAEVTVQEDALAPWLGQGTLVDVKAVPQLILYPAGAVSVQLRLYLEARNGLDLDRLAELSRGLDAWPIGLQRGAKEKRFEGVFPLLDHLADLLLARVLKKPGLRRQVPGYFLVHNLQGQVTDLAPYRAGLAHLLTGRPEAGAGDLAAHCLPPSLTRAADSLIGLDRRRAILYVDPELARRRAGRKGEGTGLVSSRRFFRQKCLTAVELAYLSAALLQDYQQRFAALEQDLALAGIESDPISRLWNRFQLGVLSPCAYGTLTDSLFGARQRLGADPSANGPLWQAVYDRALAAQEGAATLSELQQRSQRIYDLASQYRGQRAKQLQEMAAAVVKAAKELLPLVQVKIG